MRIRKFYDQTKDGLSIEDDGRAGFAFFERDGRVTGHVWLYNRVAAPNEFEMPSDGTNPLNPRDCVNDVLFAPIQDETEVKVLWKVHEGVLQGAVYIRGKIHAIVGDGDWPGWCVLARRDSPIASPLVLPS